MKYCPLCGVSREYGNGDDFCPFHQTRLVTKDYVKGGEEASTASATSATEEGEGGKSAGGSGLIGRLKNMFSFGGKTNDPTVVEGRPKEDVLPQKLTNMGWVLTASLPVQSAGAADFFKVSNADGTTAIFKRYRGGSDTSPAIYETIEGLQSARLAPLLFSGNVKAGGAEFDSELLLIADLQSLRRHLIDNPAMGEAGVKWFLREALHILNELSGNGLACSHISPYSLSIMVSGDLLLNDYSQIFPMEPEDRFIPSVKNYEIEFAAPEIVSQRIIAASKSVMFSVGAIAAQMAWGYVPSHTALIQGDLDFAGLPQGVVEPLMGLLYPVPTKRWDREDLAHWLDGETVSIPDWSRLKPGASEKAIVIHGQAIYLPEVLAEHLFRDLDAAASRLDDILDWISANPRVRDIAIEIRRHQAAGRGEDWLVLRLGFLLNPKHPRSWRGIALDEDVAAVNLAELGRRAISGDNESMNLLNKLYEAGLNDVFAGGER
jgi:hypothetical protein